ncbi:hypothetical protein KC359_g61 [Hortaea werneckii]|nr:hypothetical protein KC359_g61 [Hortaea werneckii]KAI7514808.1 hypothetical protein KC347_g57 [Hortaea werneckii]
MGGGGTYHLLDFRRVRSRARRRIVIRDDRDAHRQVGVDIIRVEVGEVGEIHGRSVLGLLQLAAGIEVADHLRWRNLLLLWLRRSGTLSLLHGRAEGARVGDFVGGDAGDELECAG